MPTILKRFDIEQLDNMVTMLNDARNGRFLEPQDLKVLKNSINNSLVGPSKLLHFINPEIFAIWDSRVSRYIENNVNMALVRNYIDYHNNIRQLIANEQFARVHKAINEYIGYPVSGMRACEYVMYKAN